jgi:glucose/arabinose dehydrogenase
MNKVVAIAVICGLLTTTRGNCADQPAKPIATGLNHPAGVGIGTDGKIYVSIMGVANKDGDGAVLKIENGKANPFASGLDDPKGIVGWNEWLFVVDKKRVWRIDRQGKSAVFVQASAFPSSPKSLQGIDVDEQGTLYVSDSGDLKGQAGAIYRIDPKGNVELATDHKGSPALDSPGSLVMDGLSHLLVMNSGSGTLYRLNLANKSTTKLADGLGAGGGLAWDKHGRLYVSDQKGGRIFGINRPGDRPVLLASGFRSVAGISLDPSGRSVLVADLEAGNLTAIPAAIPGQEVDEAPMPLVTAPAFPNLQWTGWKPEDDKGQVTPLRPIVLTHAGDGTNRVFVATQHGVIHVFPNDQKATRTQIFLDIQERVSYDDNQNEEGFLGMTFHPNFKKNGEFYVFYTLRKPKLTNVLSRFRVRPDDPNRADPTSEEELLRIQKPFWNHDGGTICFGPDGYLYIAIGDGGAANDPFNHGQDLGKLFGKVLRIDVTHKDEGKNYAIPKDNPFVKKPGARPEIWAYGLRNVWRMAFDRKTGTLWASDVGQNLYEEIDLLVAGGNYGWNVREGLHPFGANGSGPRKDLIEPIWEYHHDIGKSLTGGTVYRGGRLPELEGYYLYADYVSNKIWALRYDEAKRRVVANRRIRDPNVPVLSFGEDEKGEIYFLTYTNSGRGIHWFVRTQTPFKVTENEQRISIEGSALQASIRKERYVSGVEAQSFVDKKTGFRDLGYGLDIVDWLMEPGSDEAYRDQLAGDLPYLFNNSYHGKRAKRSIEGPQICTKAGKLSPKVIEAKDFIAVKQEYTYQLAAPGKKTGSRWEQILLFPAGKRYFLSCDKITTTNSSESLFLRIDMPGHIKHKQGDTFSEVYLSYYGKIPANEFLRDFPPDEKFLYVRQANKPPRRFIRAYHLRDPKTGRDGPWLAGMTLDQAVVSEAWCHERGYVCMIEEIGGRPIKAGQSFSAAFIVGFFDSIEEMQKVYDQNAEHNYLEVTAEHWQLSKLP